MSSDIPAADAAADAVDVIFQYQFFRLLVVHALRRVKQKEILFNILIFIKQIPQEDWNEYGYCDVITSGDHVGGIENFTWTNSLSHTNTNIHPAGGNNKGRRGQSVRARLGRLAPPQIHPPHPPRDPSPRLSPVCF